MNTKPQIQVVWLKRDLRLQDNEAIFNALKSGKRVLLLYVFEKLLINDPHYSERHWNFIKQSLVDLNTELQSYNSKVLTVKSDIIAAINQLLSIYQIHEIYSHQETGILITYNRDKSFKRFCKNNMITWHQSINNGVFRGLKDREHWLEKNNTYFETNLLPFLPDDEQLLGIKEIESLQSLFSAMSLDTTKQSVFQQGGRATALKYLDSFLNKRYQNYMSHISKPELSRTSCSRLSPYIAWGNVSIREVYQRTKTFKVTVKNKKPLDAFMSRLRWQSHFVQKFEMEHTMEDESISKEFQKLKKNVSEDYQQAWKTGQTGFPLIDACMRCLAETGYLNFRMRALIVSFFTHNLWQPWQDASKYLSQQFLDFEPGIHFPQLQMQAGATGINTLRIYNPIKNSLEHDPDAVFIKKWVPELRQLDIAFVHQPYLMTELDQIFNNFKLGADYPYPIVDIKETRKKASDILWKLRQDHSVKKEQQHIIKKHISKN